MKILPKISHEEFERRWNGVQAILTRKNLDLILAYTDDRATYGAAWGRYFANLATHFESALVMFAPRRKPVLLVGPETEGFALQTGSVEDVRVLKEFAAEDEDYPYTTTYPLRQVAQDVCPGGVRRVGIAAKHLCDANLYAAIEAAFPNAEFVRADRELEELRAVKSEEELDVIRYAYHLANLGMEAAIEAVKPGTTEREIAARAEFAMRMGGSEGTGIDTIVGCGPNSRHILARTTMRQVSENDMVLITVAPRYEGYHGACARTVIVGDPGEKAVKSLEAEIHAQEVCQANLVAGNVGSKVEAMGRGIMEEAGYGENFMYSGLHSVGVIEFEPPILGPSSETVLKDGMVVSVDIPLFEADVPGSRTEDGYILLNGKNEKLTTAPRMIRK